MELGRKELERLHYLNQGLQLLYAVGVVEKGE